MTIQPAVRQETKKIAVGVGVLSLLMIAVFLILRRFDFSVFLGALIGSAAAVLNFFLMALSVQKAADSMKPLPPAEEAEQVAGAVPAAGRRPVIGEGRMQEDAEEAAVDRAVGDDEEEDRNVRRRRRR